jgi:4-diphosphocytidyl-2-C-methyl-D-erythritol kinase
VTHFLYRTYAKVNLSLEIVGKRPDGFHELVSLVHTINLADDLRVAPASELLTRIEGMYIDPETNLIWRAARLLMQQTGERRGAELTLVKRIPAAAGLGGGSSDAASTLIGLNRLWGKRLPLHALEALAAQLGSDVPFFVRGGAALMQGRGEDLTPLRPVVGQWLALLVPAHTIEDKTRRLYAALGADDFSSGEASRRAAQRLMRDQRLLDDDCVNGFERASKEVFTGLSEAWSEAERRSGRRFHLSGAGPALFAFARSRADAMQTVGTLQDLGQTFSVRTVKHARASISIVDE